MPSVVSVVLASALTIAQAAQTPSQPAPQTPAAAPADAPQADDPIQTLVARLDLEKSTQEMEKSKQMIEKSKQVDMEIEQKRRERRK